MNSESNLITAIKEKLLTMNFQRDDLLFRDVELYRKFLSDTPIDIQATMYIKGEPITAYFNVKDTERMAILRDAMLRIKQRAYENHAYPFLAGKFFSESTRNLAIQEGVGLFDLAGNVYINDRLLHYERIVTKNPFSKNPPLKDLFAPVASRVTRVLLNKPNKTWILTDLATEAKVSIGLAHRIIDRMLESEIVSRDEKVLVLKKPGELLDSWTKQYSFYPRSTWGFYSFKQNFSSIISDVVEKAKENNLEYALCYFAGAQLVSPFLHGIGKVQLYIKDKESYDIWKNLLDLTDAPSGANIELTVAYDEGVFYGTQEVEYEGMKDVKVVSNPQLYAELYNSPARGKEQAEHLREVKLNY